MKRQQPPLGTSRLVLRGTLVRVLQYLGGATVAQLYRMIELVNPGRIVDIMILIGANNVSRSSDAEEGQFSECWFSCLPQCGKCFSALYR